MSDGLVAVRERFPTVYSVPKRHLHRGSRVLLLSFSLFSVPGESQDHCDVCSPSSIGRVVWSGAFARWQPGCFLQGKTVKPQVGGVGPQRSKLAHREYQAGHFQAADVISGRRRRWIWSPNGENRGRWAAGVQKGEDPTEAADHHRGRMDSSAAPAQVVDAGPSTSQVSLDYLYPLANPENLLPLYFVGLCEGGTFFPSLLHGGVMEWLKLYPESFVFCFRPRLRTRPKRSHLKGRGSVQFAETNRAPQGVKQSATLV